VGDCGPLLSFVVQFKALMNSNGRRPDEERKRSKRCGIVGPARALMGLIMESKMSKVERNHHVDPNFKKSNRRAC
jgi:hypothetical protein